MARTEEQLRREVGEERERLVDAVETLRGEAADARGKLKTRAPLAVAGAFGVAIGVRAGLRRLLRRD